MTTCLWMYCLSSLMIHRVHTARTGTGFGIADSYSLGAGRRVAERTADEGLLHHSPSASASRPAVQPRWKTASCVVESNAVPLGS